VAAPASKAARRKALIDQLLDELSQIAENGELKARVVEALGPHRTLCITDLVDALTELE
jgi:hypothetical protein